MVLAAIWPSWCILYPNSGSFEGGGAVDGCDVPRRARGDLLTSIRTGCSGRHGGVLFPHASQRRSCYHNTRRGVVRAGAAAMPLTVAGMAPRRPNIST
jgi:hypothetical protein